jgi:hypothetical protein
MDSGLSTGDYARAYEVQVSNDNVSFQTVANGEGSGPFVSVNFPIQQARYVRVMLKGSSGSWWSIAEFRVFQ